MSNPNIVVGNSYKGNIKDTAAVKYKGQLDVETAKNTNYKIGHEVVGDAADKAEVVFEDTITVRWVNISYYKVVLFVNPSNLWIRKENQLENVDQNPESSEASSSKVGKYQLDCNQ